MNTDNKGDLDPRSTRPFVTPEGYFDTFKATMMQRIKEVEPIQQTVASSTPKRITLLKPYLYLAAMFVGMALLFKGISWIQMEQKVSSQPSSLMAYSEDTTIFNEITEEDIDDFIAHSTSDTYLVDYLLPEEE